MPALQLDGMEVKLDEAKLTEDRLCAEMSSLRLEQNPDRLPSTTRSIIACMLSLLPMSPYRCRSLIIGVPRFISPPKGSEDSRSHRGGALYHTLVDVLYGEHSSVTL